MWNRAVWWNRRPENLADREVRCPASSPSGGPSTCSARSQAGRSGVTEVADRVRPAQVDGRAPADDARPRGRRGAGPGRHALPARPAARDARRAGSRRPARWPPSPTPSLGGAGRGRRARRPACRVPDGDLVHYIDQVDTPEPGLGPRLDRARACRCTRSRPGRCCSRSGRRRPSSAISSGRWSGSRRAPSSDPDALRERLREIRRDGYAWAIEEFDEGISSVAAPIADASGEVIAAVHLHGPSYRFPADGAAAAIAEAVVGGRGPDRGGLRRT